MPSPSRGAELGRLVLGSVGAVALIVMVGFGARTATSLATTHTDHATAYTFLAHQATDSAEPVAYSPCQPVHFVINDHGAPPGAYRMTVQAIREIARASGLTLVVDGRTGEMPIGDRPVGSFPSWTPVLVAWTDDVIDPRLHGSVEGVAGSQPVVYPRSGIEVYVTGTARIESAQMATFLRHGDKAQVRAVLLHELGHVIGLGHVDDPTQIMYPTSGGARDLGLGDRAGLARLGHGYCIT